MGNHTAGKAMGIAAEVAVSVRRDGEDAMAILDRICAPWRGADAEFGAEDPANPGRCHPDFGNYFDPHPKAALGMMMVEAFAPRGMADLPRYRGPDGGYEEASYQLWWVEVLMPFSNRYDFC